MHAERDALVFSVRATRYSLPLRTAALRSSGSAAFPIREAS